MNQGENREETGWADTAVRATLGGTRYEVDTRRREPAEIARGERRSERRRWSPATSALLAGGVLLSCAGAIARATRSEPSRPRELLWQGRHAASDMHWGSSVAGALKGRLRARRIKRRMSAPETLAILLGGAAFCSLLGLGGRSKHA